MKNKKKKLQGWSERKTKGLDKNKVEGKSFVYFLKITNKFHCNRTPPPTKKKPNKQVGKKKSWFFFEGDGRKVWPMNWNWKKKKSMKNWEGKLRRSIFSVSYFKTGLRWQGQYFSEHVGDCVLGSAFSAHVKYSLPHLNVVPIKRV